MDQQTAKQQKKLNTIQKPKQNKLFKDKVSASFKSGLKDSWFDIIKQLADSEKRNKICSIQSQINYKKMYENGICQIDDTHFNMCIKYEDINYRLASQQEQQRIFSSYASLLNYFDPTVAVQMSAINAYTDDSEDRDALNIDSKDDNYKVYRDELKGFLISQLSKGNNNLKKNKYITFTIESNDFKTAQSKLNRIRSEIIVQLKSIGVAAKCLNGLERIEIIHDVLNDPRKEKLNLSNINFEKINKYNIDTKSYIIPQLIDTSDKNKIRVKNKYGNKYFTILELQITAPVIYDTIMAELMDMNSEMIITSNFNTVNPTNALKLVKSKQSALIGMQAEVQKKAVREGYDMDAALPPDLQKSISGANSFYDELTRNGEKMFVASFYITLSNKSKDKLDEDVFQAQSIIQKHNCNLVIYEYAGFDGINTFLPLGRDDLYPSRTLTTSALSIFIPFTTQELFQARSIYYGLNKLSQNMIMANRKLLKNPNGLLLGVPGAGKSFASKLEILMVFLTMIDDILISDPEGEYSDLTHALGGTEIVFSTSSDATYYNPLEISDNYSDDDNPIALKQDLIKSIMEIVLNRNNGKGLEPLEISAIDRATNYIYRKWNETKDPNDIPILSDLRNALEKDTESSAAQLMAEALYSYTEGSLNLFNHKTNIDTSNRMISFNIRDLPKSMKKLGMLIIQDAIWNRVSTNRNISKNQDEKKYTWVYFDEFHLLLKEPQTASFSVEIWKRLRKWGGIPTGMTQNVKDFLMSQEIENIFDITDFYVLLSQGAGDIEILGEKLKISASELDYIENVEPGEGLIKYGPLIVPFKNDFPTDTKIFKLINTSPKFAKKE